MWGFCDKDKNIVIQPIYKSVSFFKNNFSIVTSVDGKFGTINKEGKEVIPCKYEVLDFFIDGLACAKLNSKWGYVDSEGNESIPFIYEVGVRFNEGLALVRLNSKWGYIDNYGKDIISLKYDEANSFDKGLARVSLNGKFGFIDKNGKEVIPIKYDSIGFLREECVACKLKGFWGYINKEGKEIISLKYDRVGSLSEGLVSIKLKGKWGYLNKEGKEIIPLKYDDVRYFKEGLACVKYKGKWGFVDKNGKEVIPLKYDSDAWFADGFARLKLYNKWGYINKDGKEVIPFKYEDIREFREGFIGVKFENSWGFINAEDKEVIVFKYDNVYSFNKGLAVVESNNNYGYININGTEYFDDINTVVPAGINMYEFGYDKYNVFVPYNLNRFPLLKSNPLAGYLFATMMDENKIRNLTVEQLKSRNIFGKNNSCHLYYLKGCEKLNSELANIDEFDLTAKKNEFIETLVDVWKKYNEEYEELMQKEFIVNYGFRYSYGEAIPNEYNSKSNDKESLRKYEYNTEYYQVKKNNYNFGNQVMTFPFPVLGSGSNGHENWSWTRLISGVFSKEIMSYSWNTEFKEVVPLDVAKVLVQDDVYGYFSLKIKLKKGFNGVYWEAGVKHLQLFDIVSLSVTYKKANEVVYEKIF
jgi:hypothetical protein